MSVELLARENAPLDISVQELLGLVLSMDGSDLHLTAGARPTIRIHGDLKPLEQFGVLDAER